MFSENLKTLRKQKGFSQEELAGRLHVVRQTISKWEKNLSVPDADTLIREFRAAGYRILSAGIRDSVSVFDGEFPYPVLLVVGGEKRGISRQLLEASDGIVRVDYGREFRGSLSASAACAVLAFEIFRQNRSRKKG